MFKRYWKDFAIFWGLFIVFVAGVFFFFYLVRIFALSVSAVRSLTTSPAIISPTTDGTNALLPGIWRRAVHFLCVPGGQMQCERQLISSVSSGFIASSSE